MAQSILQVEMTHITRPLTIVRALHNSLVEDSGSDGEKPKAMNLEIIPEPLAYSTSMQPSEVDAPVVVIC